MMKKNIKGHLVYKAFKQLLKVLKLLLTKAESKQKSVPKMIKVVLSLELPYRNSLRPR